MTDEQEAATTEGTVTFALKTGGPVRLVFPTPQLRIRLAIDPQEAASQDDRFTLKATDGSYEKTLTVKDDYLQGDAFLDLVFDNLKVNCRYTLEIDPGREGKPYTLFEDVPFMELVEYYSLLEPEDTLEDTEAEPVAEVEPEELSQEPAEEDEGGEIGGDPDDFNDELDNWWDDEEEEDDEVVDWERHPPGEPPPGDEV